MAPVRVLAFAGGSLGTALLDLLGEHAGCQVVGVVASHAAGGRREPDPFAVAWARRHGVATVYVPTWRGADARAVLDGLGADLQFSLAYDLILPPAVLALAPRAVNLHRGIAPDFRGAYSTTWALEHGAAEVGVTLHAMVPDVDAGPVLAQRRLAVPDAWTAAEAIPAVEALAVDLVRDTLDDLLAERLVARPQGPGGHVYGRVLPSHELDPHAFSGLRERARALHNPPYPGPHVRVGARRLALTEVAPAVAAPARPGRLAPVAARADNRPGLTFGRPAAWLEDVDAALEAIGRVAGGPVVAEAGAAPGTAALVPWVHGRPPGPERLEAVRRAGALAVEDRRGAFLSTSAPEGDLVLLDPSEVLDLGGALVVGSHAGAGGDERAWFELCFCADLPAARLAALAAAARLMAALAARCPVTHWPPGAVPSWFPVRTRVAPEALVAALADAGLPAEVLADAAVGLPLVNVDPAGVAAVVEAADPWPG